MINRIYIEKGIESHPRVLKILKRYPDATIVGCDNYSEIFNRKAQNFRLQKLNPGLILANKLNNLILPAPDEFGIGSNYNYYFSHMLNCLYDCRYCFLQGMYRSANYVLFINYENFRDEIVNLARNHQNREVHFFSGYDCDSLAMEPISGFVKYILSAFKSIPNALLELRTKSTQIRTLLTHEPIKNCVVAFSLTPERIANALEHKAPNIKSRLRAIYKLQKSGWPIGLRFDPLIYDSDFMPLYKQLFYDIFRDLNIDLLHSVSIGTFRLPKKFYKNMSDYYPEEKLFASPIVNTKGTIYYQDKLRKPLYEYCYRELLKYVPATKIFPSDSVNYVT